MSQDDSQLFSFRRSCNNNNRKFKPCNVIDINSGSSSDENSEILLSEESGNEGKLDRIFEELAIAWLEGHADKILKEILLRGLKETRKPALKRKNATVGEEKIKKLKVE